MAKYSDLVQQTANANPDLTKKAVKAVLDSFFEQAQNSLVSQGEIATPLGLFKVKQREERKGRNPATGKELTIPASKAVKYSTPKGLKDALNS